MAPKKEEPPKPADKLSEVSISLSLIVSYRPRCRPLSSRRLMEVTRIHWSVKSVGKGMMWKRIGQPCCLLQDLQDLQNGSGRPLG